MLPVTKRAIPLGPCRAHAQPKDRWADGVKAVSRRRRWRAAPALGPAVHRSTKTQLLLGAVHRLAEIRIDLLGPGVGTLRRRPREDRLQPALQMREVVDVLVLVLVGHDPGIACHV